MGNTVLGVDQSLSHTVGHCSEPEFKFEIHGALSSGSGKKKKVLHGSSVARLAHIESEFSHFLAKCGGMEPGWLFLEGYAMGSRFGREALGEWGGAIRLAAYRAGWKLVVVAPTSLKKFVISGKADKDAMRMECLDVFKYKSLDDDDCDAYCLMQLGKAYLAYRGGELQNYVKELVVANGLKESPYKRWAEVLSKLEVIEPAATKAA